ncbi:hypothetical protein N7522_005658 [Penicillium canescens]|nr:hypothetical protein N7522_005658 [Penicillium canescens]
MKLTARPQRIEYIHNGCNILDKIVDCLQGQYRELMLAMQQQARERIHHEDCVKNLAGLMDIMLFRWCMGMV